MSHIWFLQNKFWWGFLTIMLAVNGWTSDAPPEKLKPIVHKINQIVSYVDRGQWDQANMEIESLRKQYRKEKWKLQLVANSKKYGYLEQEVDKLMLVSMNKDKMETETTLVTICKILDTIYSM